MRCSHTRKKIDTTATRTFKDFPPVPKK